MSEGSEIWHDPSTGAVIINETTIPDADIFAAINQQAPEIAALSRWGSQLSNPGRRNGSIFQRDRYVTPNSIFDQFKIAQDAAESDDVVSGVLETTESLSFKSIRVECEDEQEEDIWNQITSDLRLDDLMRQMWRETFIVSQLYGGVLWTNKSYKVKKKTDKGNKSKKAYDGLAVPRGVTIFDPLKIVPVGNLMFGQESLAWIASRDEATHIDKVLAGVNTADIVATSFLSGRYKASKEEKKFLQELTGADNLDYLFEMNPDLVFRHTATRPDYMRLAAVRMKSVFEILDMKHQLRQMDRSYLIGGTNFIILVKKGSDEYPASGPEVAQLANQVKATSRVPIIVGDHRIEIEIITPDMDLTLKPDRYNGLDARIAARLYQMFMTGNYAAGAKGDDSIKLARVVAAGMEARRTALGETVMKHIIEPIYERNDKLEAEPTLVFSPNRIALDFDPNYANYILDLRQGGDLSRNTALAHVDIDEDDEARKREREKKHDKLFEPPNMPPAGQMRAGGRAGGGNANGGGMNKESNETKPARGPAKPESEKPKSESK